MNLIEYSIQKPVTIAVGVLFILLFGVLAIMKIPVQLTPEVEDIKIEVETVWRGASPHEIEREIVQEQEEQLKSVEGLLKMKSECYDGLGKVILEFKTGTSMDSALLEVSNKLNQVPEYPKDADEPVITSAGEQSDAIAWFIIYRREGDPDLVERERNFIEDYIKPLLERVEGVSQSNVYGGRDQEMHVLFDPKALAARKVILQDVFELLDRENQNISAGDVEESKRRYVVRTVGQYRTPEDVEEVVLRDTGEGPIRLRDVAKVELGYREADIVVRERGITAIAINAERDVGANVLDVMKELKRAVAEINRDLLGPRGLEMIQVYDATEYIYSALDLVRQNLWMGGLLAVGVLLFFLRSGSSTLIIALAIPISVIGSFVLMAGLGRTINVISLAGMAFAVGLVVDNAIVVLENVFRHRQLGEGRETAARAGAEEVWGAILASTLTTVAVFLPVIFVEEEVGQLFKDIAVAVSCAVVLSLMLAITLIPTLAARYLSVSNKGKHTVKGNKLGNTGGVPRRRRFGLNAVGRAIAFSFAGIFNWGSRGVFRRVFIIVAMTGLSIAMALFLKPKVEYLPEGNRNMLYGFLIPPPGYNNEELLRVGGQIESYLSAHWDSFRSEDENDGTPETRTSSEDGAPRIGKYFFIASPRFVFSGGSAQDPDRVRELIPVIRQAFSQIPGLIGVVQQASIFRMGSEGRSIDVEIMGPDLNRLIALGGRIFGQILHGMPGSQVRPLPSLDLAEPEVRVIPDRDRAASLGLTASQIGSTIAAMVDGVIVSDYWYQGDKIDLVLLGRDGRPRRIEDLADLGLRTPRGNLVTVGDVARVELVSGPKQINHVERLRAITLRVIPSSEMPLQAAMEWLQENVIDALRKQGEVKEPYQIRLAGTADKLTETWGALKWNFLLALVISFLLMSALFESFLYPFVILFSVPLAAAGGFLGLFAVNQLIGYQSLDSLTMLGFIILIGIVVNNAILLVHQSLRDMREGGLGSKEAIHGAILKRVRPIFMSACTSIFGMLPLVLSGSAIYKWLNIGGAGSEIYQGLGSVVVGGLAVSTLFTLILVPAVLSLVFDTRAGLARVFGRGERRVGSKK